MVVDRIVIEQDGIFRIEISQKCGLLKADPKYALELTNPRGVIDLLPEENLLRSSLGGKIPVELILAPEYSVIKKAGSGFYMTFTDDKASLFSLAPQSFCEFPDGTTDISDIHNQMIPCRVKEKWGLYNLSGNEIIRPVFDNISWVDSYWIITNKGKSAILSSDLKVIHNSNYSFVTYLGHGLFSAKQFSHRFILSGSGEIIKGKRVFFEPIGNVGFKIQVNGKFGLLSNSGKIIVTPQFDTLRKIWPGNVFIGRKKDLYGLCSLEKGMLLPPNYSKIKVADPERFLLLQENKKWGIIDLCGNANLTPQLDHLDSPLQIKPLFSNDCLGDTYSLQEHYLLSEKIRFQEKTDDGLFVIRNDKQWMLINKNGKNFIGDGCEEIFHITPGLLRFRKHGKYGIVKTNGDLICSPVFCEISLFEKTLLKIRNENSCELFDPNLQKLLPLKYDDIQSFSADYLKVRTNGKYGLADYTGKETLLPIYDDIQSMMNYWLIKYNGKWGLDDTYGNEFISPQYDEIQIFNGVNIKVRIGNMWGLLDSNGKVILLLQYNEILLWDDIYLKTRIGRKWGVMDLAGNEILPVRYDSILGQTDSGFKVYYGQKHGIVSPGDLKFREYDPPGKNSATGSMTGSQRINISQMGHDDDSNKYDFSSN